MVGLWCILDCRTYTYIQVQLIEANFDTNLRPLRARKNIDCKKFTILRNICVHKRISIFFTLLTMGDDLKVI